VRSRAWVPVCADRHKLFGRNGAVRCELCSVVNAADAPCYGDTSSSAALMTCINGADAPCYLDASSCTAI
jgi:hypothetical protein